MTTEPKRKQKNIKEVHKFVVLNHILTSYIATIASGLSSKNTVSANPENIKLVKRGINILNDTIAKLKTHGAQCTVKLRSLQVDAPKPTPDKIPAPSLEAHLLKEQLEFIVKVCNDTAKIVDTVLEE